MTALCIPDEADRGRDGWHVVWMTRRPWFLFWHAAEARWTFDGDLRLPCKPRQMTKLGYRYGGPAPEAKEAKP